MRAARTFMRGGNFTRRLASNSSSTLTFAGTSQDLSSEHELITKIYNVGKQNQLDLQFIDGPGSVGRSLQYNQPSSIEDMGPGLDYGYNLVSGVVSGNGFSEGVAEGVDAMMSRISSSGPIYLVGFSRGAVTIMQVLKEVAKHVSIHELPEIHIKLLDPVSGPFVIPGSFVIPNIVTSASLYVSKHEGRLGFAQTGISFEGPVNFTSEMCIGVHGDIGGSCQSAISDLILSDTLHGYRLSGDGCLTEGQYLQKYIHAFLSCKSYSDKLKMTTREFNGWNPSARADLEMPLSSDYQGLHRSVVFKVLTGLPETRLDDRTKELLRHELDGSPELTALFTEKVAQGAKGGISLMSNPPPTLVPNGQVTNTPPIIQQFPPIPEGLVADIKEVTGEF